MECLIGQRTLGFGEEPGQVLGKFRQGAFAASKPSLGSMGTKIHGGTSPLAPCCTVHVRALSMCQLIREVVQAVLHITAILQVRNCQGLTIDRDSAVVIRSVLVTPIGHPVA